MITLSKKSSATRWGAILRVNGEIWISSSKAKKPGINKIATDHADLADQFVQFVTLPPALPTMRFGVILRLFLDLFRMRFLENNREFCAKLGKMVEQLCVREIVRRRNPWISTDCSNPGLENFLTVAEHKIAKPSEGRVRGFLLTGTGHGVFLKLVSAGKRHLDVNARANGGSSRRRRRDHPAWKSRSRVIFW
jgi:hypothetical protein